MAAKTSHKLSVPIIVPVASTARTIYLASILCLSTPISVCHTVVSVEHSIIKLFQFLLVSPADPQSGLSLVHVKESIVFFGTEAPPGSRTGYSTGPW